MKSFLYHGTPNGKTVKASGVLRCASYPEYSFDVPYMVLSLTRCIRFATYYATLERDTPLSPLVVVLDRDILRSTHKIRAARSCIFDEVSDGLNRDECEEFAVKQIPLHHPAILDFLHPTP